MTVLHFSASIYFKIQIYILVFDFNLRILFKKLVSSSKYTNISILKYHLIEFTTKQCW